MQEGLSCMQGTRSRARLRPACYALGPHARLWPTGSAWVVRKGQATCKALCHLRGFEALGGKHMHGNVHGLWPGRRGAERADHLGCWRHA